MNFRAFLFCKRRNSTFSVIFNHLYFISRPEHLIKRKILFFLQDMQSWIFWLFYFMLRSMQLNSRPRGGKRTFCDFLTKFVQSILELPKKYSIQVALHNSSWFISIKTRFLTNRLIFLSDSYRRLILVLTKPPVPPLQIWRSFHAPFKHLAVYLSFIYFKIELILLLFCANF